MRWCESLRYILGAGGVVTAEAMILLMNAADVSDGRCLYIRE